MREAKTIPGDEALPAVLWAVGVMAGRGSTVRNRGRGSPALPWGPGPAAAAAAGVGGGGGPCRC